MNLSLSESQLLLKESVSRMFQTESTGVRIRAAEASGLDRELWATFNDLGLPLLRVSEAHGGAQGGLLDAVVVAEEAGASAAMIPVADSIVVNGLLSDLGGEAALALLARTLEGRGILGLALRDAALEPEQLVASAAVADAVIFRRGDEIRCLATQSAPPAPNTGSLPARRLRFEAGAGDLLAQGPDAVRAFCAAIEEWTLLNAAAMAAAARKSIIAAAQYASEREAFGRPIGSFQGLAHPLADAFVDVDGAALLVWRAVETIANDGSKAAALISLSAWWSAQASVNAVIKAMRAYGGYGVTLEYDAQIYYRRVIAWSLLLGDPARSLDDAADRLWPTAANPVALPQAGDVHISFAFSAQAEAAADIARRVFADHMDDARRLWVFHSKDAHDPELNRKLARVGVLYPDWPVEHGGGGFDNQATAAIHNVYVEYKLSNVIPSIADMTGKLIMRFGSPEARTEILPRLASGESYVCLCYSEPSCGSDIFAARTTATRDGDDWLINGQKIFTSQGHFADYGLMIARTGAEKHAGVTLFVVPLNQPGYSCDRIDTLGDERTNTTFYADVRVPDKYRVGEVNGGAKLLAAALAMEQGSSEFFIVALKRVIEPAIEWAKSTRRGAGLAIEEPDVRRRLAAAWARLEVADAISRRNLWASDAGLAQKHYGPSSKLFISESWLACGVDLMRLCAPFSLLQGDDPLGHLEKESRAAVAGTIYAGTSEVQRSIVAEAGLKLPRSRS
jgi:alkylation response protein AidB-like acyl-CoA dehydrogenase